MLLAISVLLLPYNNLPIFHAGTLKPLSALVIVPVAGLFLLRRALATKQLRFRGFDVAFVGMLLTFVAINLAHLALGVPDQTKPQSAWQRTAELLLFTLVTAASYVVGRRAGWKLSTRRFALLVLIAFTPSLVVGILQVLTHNGAFTQQLRHVVTSTSYPQGYYRIALLTTEPSWAAFDLSALVLPFTLVALVESRTRRARFALAGVIALETILVIMTKSALGVLLLVALGGYLLARTWRRHTAWAVATTILAIALAVSLGPAIMSTTPYLASRYERLGESLASRRPLEQSAATRVVSYVVALGYSRATH